MKRCPKCGCRLIEDKEKSLCPNCGIVSEEFEESKEEAKYVG